MKPAIALTVLAGTIWLLAVAPAYAQDTTEYSGTTGQAAAPAGGFGALGSALSNQIKGEAQAVNPQDTPSYDSGSDSQGQTATDNGGSPAPSEGSAGEDDNN